VALAKWGNIGRQNAQLGLEYKYCCYGSALARAALLPIRARLANLGYLSMR